jgi:energy-converting hydrogenase Eha subunit F
MNRKKPTVISKLQERFRKMDVGRGLYTAFLMPTMLSMISTRAFAADTIWTKASAIMQDVYTQILGISTVAAVVTAAVALLLMNFSRSGRTVDESRAWLKRIIITWAILNSLGFIMAYVTPFFAGGTWTP